MQSADNFVKVTPFKSSHSCAIYYCSKANGNAMFPSQPDAPHFVRDMSPPPGGLSTLQQQQPAVLHQQLLIHLNQQQPEEDWENADAPLINLTCYQALLFKFRKVSVSSRPPRPP